MTDIFGKAVYELCPYLRLFLLSSKKGDKIRILDWTDSLTDDVAYDFFISSGMDKECAEKSLCRFPVNIDSFCEETRNNTKCLKFNSISPRDIKNNSYDLVVLRHMTDCDNGIYDVIKHAAKALKDSGVLYTNLIITKELDEIFEAAEKYELYPATATKIIMERGLLGYGGEIEEKEFKALYDIQGYIQLAFRKEKCEKFLYTEVSDSNFNSVEHPFAIDFLTTAFATAFDRRKCILKVGDDKWIRSSEEVDIAEVKKYISRMKEDSCFNSSEEPLIPNSVKIRFSDYFEADIPHHIELSELRPKEYYYLSPSIAIHCMIDNIVNSDNPLLTDDILRQINFNNMGNIYDLIDNNGKVIDNAMRWTIIRGKESILIGKGDIEEVPPIELYALNNIADAGIDIEGTLLYNLIRIKPKSNQINLNYIKMFFHTDELIRLTTLGDITRVNYSSSVLEKLKDNVNLQPGYYAIRYFCDNHCFLNIWEDNHDPDENSIWNFTSYGTYTVDDVLGSYIYVDDPKNHKKLIERFRLKFDGSFAQYEEKVQKRFADIAFLNKLRKREKEVRSSYDAGTLTNLINVEKQLAKGERIYDFCLNEDISLLDYFVAIEIYLKLCLACCKNKGEIDCGNDRYGKGRYIEDIGKFMMNDLCYIYCNRNNRRYLFKNDVAEYKYNLLQQRLSKYRDARNEAAHSYSVVKADDVVDLINEIYETLMLIDEMVAD